MVAVPDLIAADVQYHRGDCCGNFMKQGKKMKESRGAPDDPEITAAMNAIL